ncbi:MAG: dynamin family protein [Litoreibacter sp.]|nr:dynamin family protein [Litoreibacter sp.]
MSDLPPDKPCIALMGEFSAGKSTLANLLIGKKHLPEQIIATQLPPVWLSHGSDSAHRVDLDGVLHELELTRLDEAPLESTSYIKIFTPQDLLLECDLLDMPSISDPNMASEIWQRMLGHADGVIWCSHATQAWRQSEAAVWAQQDPALFAKSILLLTRIDKLVNDADRARVLKRVKRETDGLFRDCLPISLLHAVNEAENPAIWQKSGAEEFARALADLLRDISREKGIERPSSTATSRSAVLDIPAFVSQDQEEPAESVSKGDAAAEPVKVMPKRIKLQRSLRSRSIFE